MKKSTIKFEEDIIAPHVSKQQQQLEKKANDIT
jgi:hypothetical protein